MDTPVITNHANPEEIIRVLHDLEEASPHDEAARNFLMLFRPWALSNIKLKKN